MLTPNERLALPGTTQKVTWVTGDATLERFGGVDWTNSLMVVEEVKDFFPALREVVKEAAVGAGPAAEHEGKSRSGGTSTVPPAGSEAVDQMPGGSCTEPDPCDDQEACHEASEEPVDDDLIISLAELLTLVAMAAALGAYWTDTLVFYVGDNMNVQRWLDKRKAGNPFARYLLRVLSAIEASHSFEVLSSYLRTYHNVTADAITRESKEEIERLRV